MKELHEDDALNELNGEAAMTSTEREAVARRAQHGPHDSSLFVKTRLTLLQRVNNGDKEAFVKFYNLYCPAMLKYLGLIEGAKTERDQWDVVQTVFAKFYKKFAQVENPETGERIIPADLMAILSGEDKKTGKAMNRKFRYYLQACLKNAVRAKWRKETKGGKVKVCSIDTPISPDEDKTWREILESQGVDTRTLDLKDEEGERLAAVWGIWRAVVKGFLFDGSIEEWKRESIYAVLARGASISDQAAQWGIRKNAMEVTLTRGKQRAREVTKKIYEMLAEKDVDFEKETRRLYEMVSKMKPTDEDVDEVDAEGNVSRKPVKSPKRINVFMIELAKGLLE